MMQTLFKFFLLFILIFCTLEHLEAKKSKYKHELAVCAVFQNEARFLKEWIEFHKLVGVTHFFLYNNLSTDEFKQVLSPYIANGEVEIIDWNYPSDTIEQWTPIQISAYKNAIRRAVEAKIKWLAIIDTDEFIVPVVDSNVVTFLQRFNEVGGVTVNWQYFGTSNVERTPDDKLMIEMLTKKGPEKYEANSFVKSIVRPERVVGMFDPHTVVYRKPYFAVDADGNRVQAAVNLGIPISKIRLNHYWSRDNQFFMEHKLARRQKWWNETDKLLQKLDKINVVDDFTIFRFIPALREKMNLN